MKAKGQEKGIPEGAREQWYNSNISVTEIIVKNDGYYYAYLSVRDNDGQFKGGYVNTGIPY